VLRTFGTPVPWGLGPGPAQLYSIGGALTAVSMWLEVTPSYPETRREHELMLTLRDTLTKVPLDAGPADLEAARRAIEGMVQYSRSREAEDARIDAKMGVLRAVPRRPRIKSSAPVGRHHS